MDKRVAFAFFGAAVILGIVYFSGRPDGAGLFRREGCIGCHSFRGQGGLIGPDLTAVTHRRSKGWIREQIRNPRRHNADTVMPSFDHLSWREIDALLDYLDSSK